MIGITAMMKNDFGEALHRRTEELYSIPDAAPDEDGLIECPVLPLARPGDFPAHGLAGFPVPGGCHPGD